MARAMSLETGRMTVSSTQWNGFYGSSYPNGQNTYYFGTQLGSVNPASGYKRAPLQVKRQKPPPVPYRRPRCRGRMRIDAEEKAIHCWVQPTDSGYKLAGTMEPPICSDTVRLAGLTPDRQPDPRTGGQRCQQQGFIVACLPIASNGVD